MGIQNNAGVRYKKCSKKKQLINSSKTQKEVAKASERCAFPNTHTTGDAPSFLFFFLNDDDDARSILR